MYYIYIIQSGKNGSFYTGYTEDIDKRLEYHNSGKVKSTRYSVPYKVVYTEVYESATEARRWEYYIKSQKSRKYIESLVNKGG